MNRILDLDSLIHDTKSRERNKLASFEHVLLRCHAQIARFAKDHKATECKFSIPITMFGFPPYNPVTLINYLLSHLRDNGLSVDYIQSENKLYISWKQEDINYARYKKRKDRIMHSRHTDISYMNEEMQKKKTSFHDFLRRN